MHSRFSSSRLSTWIWPAFLDMLCLELQSECRPVMSPLSRHSRGVGARSGRPPRAGGTPPAALLGDVLDAEEVVSNCVASGAAADSPVDRRAARSSQFEGEISEATRSRFECLAAAIGTSFKRLLTRHRNQRRLQRLEAILEIAGQWNQNLEMESLLSQMAETSTRLLGAERASIFIWDRPHRGCRGPPRPGCRQGRIANSRQCRDRRPGRADRRSLDALTEMIRRTGSTDMSTSSWAFRHIRCCVCRCAGARARFGAFEMINKRDGNFTPEDEVGLDRTCRTRRHRSGE